MSRRDDRDRSRTRRRRDRSPSSPPRKARRRDQDDTLVSDGMDWNNLITQSKLQRTQCLSNDAEQLPAEPLLIAALSAPSGQLHDAVPS